MLFLFSTFNVHGDQAADLPIAQLLPGPEGVSFDGALHFVGQKPLKQACVVVQSKLSC